MRSVRDTYDLPKRSPLPLRSALIVIVFPLVALAAWRLTPHSPIMVAVVAVALLTAVFVGVGKVLRSRELDKKPEREPVTPPSAERG